MFTFILVLFCVLLILLIISVLDMLFSGDALYILLPCSLFLSVLLYILSILLRFEVI